MPPGHLLIRVGTDVNVPWLASPAMGARAISPQFPSPVVGAPRAGVLQARLLPWP
eukprot:CAMPEP_0198570558 /NCGR_PEP_ID=MMETSP1462-20131121/109268_1 /TAXON_ID=1333877 /ORGANISM="Brandtodinium nutriculum, Strain RCC3387" /LENGTH=54 /DNA_ID=CAMNT_0044301679 /DNA_START=1 /DNA_END=162 /DNA_ORIENTATION=+